MKKSDLPVLDPLDRRINLLDERGGSLDGSGTPAGIDVAFTELRAEPNAECAIDTQLMFGERVDVHDIQDGWAWVQAKRDRYVGWLEATTLTYDIKDPTHIVSVPRTFFYPEPDLKKPHKGMRSMGSAVTIVDWQETRGTKYGILSGGESIVARHVRPIGDWESDFVSVCENLMYTPYLWAGTTAFGIDCSGLIKLALFMCGTEVLRDSDMQAATLGCEIDPGDHFEHVRRGDLVFWNGHVAICQGPLADGTQMIIHANGHSMNVASEPLMEAIERIAYLYEKPIGVRRP